ncbi:bifunctional metallophosphatase/5'-nucleotidase [Janibacter cremeus]|uniref:5'-nucleotidase n=1 Tax=Janibacter cremeus TaxID=1285192 RepID=A0A852VTL8_9MICO|nr:bifunctional UDP-sugar hydrolase/5'-nucleotidase [Janibacter cremeus]NYF98003.1 5'-nucleotidase [Janibacter cremeus]
MSITSRGASLVVGAGAALALVATAGAAHAADPVDPGGIDPALTAINVLNINDFHGRIDSDGTGALGKNVACTIESAKTALGEKDTLLLSAGDNIGASPFVSSSQQDTPTLEFLNALGMDASAVGNHEFDRGFADLTGRVSDTADFDYLGANVYDKGTTSPALDEYSIQEVNGLDVAVIGAVTGQTSSLVSPAGITEVEFGDPVAAVNRVATQLTDGDDANGEADVVIAEYHEGATSGASTLAEQLALGGAFANIANNTSGDVDAIFTGHTHQQYAWDAADPDGGTRPIVQSGSYGDPVGQVELGVDPDTGEVRQYASSLLPTLESSQECVGDAEFDAAASIVDTAVAEAEVIGREVIGEVSDDITTAVPVDDERDDRQRESTLGNLTADIWLDAMNLQGRPGADIGIMNPGGLRDELYYEPARDEAPGAVTFAEAAAINPFANTLMTVDVTGEQFITALEQQWQPDGASRPFLKLAVSDNVSYTFDPDAADGERITSVTVDGEPIDPAATYTVTSGSFLLSGGDNFTVLAEGSNSTDSGLIDTDAFVDYFTARDVVEPDFAKRAIAVDALPSELVAGEKVSFTASGFDLTSVDSPTNTEVEVLVGETSLGTFPITAGLIDGLPTRNGTADIAATVPEGMTGDAAMTLVASPSGTTSTFPVTIAGGAADQGDTDQGDTDGAGTDDGAAEPERPDLVQTDGFVQGPGSTVSAFLVLVGVGMLLGLALTRRSRS